MDTRAILTKTLDAVRKDYRNHLINSERCLQACLYKYLSEFVSHEDYQVFVEPTFDPGEKCADCNGKKPDIVVTKSREITQVWEIKFVPEGYPGASDDLGKLYNLHENIANFKTHISLMLNGKWDDKLYELTENTSYIFMVFGRDDSKAVNFGDLKKEYPYFKELIESESFYHLAVIVNKVNKDEKTNPICEINGKYC